MWKQKLGKQNKGSGREANNPGRKQDPDRREKEPGMISSIIMFFLVVGVMLSSVIFLKLEPHVPLFLCSVLLILFGMWLHVPWRKMEKAIYESISGSLEAIVLVMLVGAVISMWIASGTVPVIIYYGLKLLSPRWFLLLVFLLCCAMAVTTGSSWTTTATLGIAFIGIGTALGVPDGVTAGAIISGAYFGDKQSPIAASANFAAAVSGSGLYDMVAAMLYTSLPALLSCALIFAFLGRKYQTTGGELTVMHEITGGLSASFSMHPVCLLPLVLLFLMILLKVPAFLTMIVAIASGAFIAVLVQGMDLKEILGCIYSGYSASSGNALVDTLLNRGGFTYMSSTVMLLMLSMMMAGCLKRTGIMEKVMTLTKHLVRGERSLIITTLIMAIILTCATGDLYPSQLITSNAMQKDFDRYGVSRSTLGRTLQDGTVIVTVMQPWSSCGIYSAMTLGVAVTSFMPFYFMGYLTPLFSILLALTGVGIGHSRVRPGIQADNDK